MFNGVWTDWQHGNMVKKYLYLSGDECGSLTGGYGIGYYAPHCTAVKTANNNYLQITITGDKQYGTWAWAITRNPINTTGYSKLKAKYHTSVSTLKAALSLTQQYAVGAQNASTNISYPTVVTKTDALGSVTPIEVELNLTGYQGNYYVVLGARECYETGSVYCSEIYLV